MPPHRRTRVKICCISSLDEARMAIDHGADALGLVGQMPSGPGVISDEMIARIAAATPPTIDTFLLTSETSAAGIIAHHRKVNTSTIQIVDALAEGTYEQIREALPGIKLVQVIHVIDERSVREAIGLSVEADAILLDSGNPNLATKELGGTGRTHNWKLSRRIRDEINIPVFLAGGLKPDNVRQAVEAVHPFGVDLCSGVRTDGRLDPDKLNTFFQAIQLP